MRNQSIYNYLFICLIAMTIPAWSVNAQDAVRVPSVQKKLLVRDSLDYKNIPLVINTSSNEFSPIPYKGGLMYISNKPIQKEKIAFNKIYWTKDSGFKIIDKININFNSTDTTIMYIKEGKTDDYTAPTSNDNDILVRYKKMKGILNNIEISFSNFTTDQVFTYDDSTKLLIYAKKSSRGKGGVKHWSLWQAYLINGKLKYKKRIEFTDRNADYLYPFLSEDGSKLYLSSNIKNGKGGYDIYYVNMQKGVVSTSLIALNDINSRFDEIGPSVINDTLFFSSNKEGGLGGFDAYYFSSNSKSGIQNIGYPVNSEKDEVSIKKVFDAYYLTTNRNGNFDILNLEYLPISYTISGVLTYRNDGSLAPNHLMYLKDKDAGLILDSITTDNFAKYSFKGKPNRDYEFTTLNGDSLYEQFSIQTIPNQNKFDYISYINGRSPKQKVDSLNALWVVEEKRKVDSLARYSLNTKFVVRYEFDKSIISTKEKLVLDSLINKLSFLPNVFISVGAFTDCIGSYKYNYLLSVKRGKAVVDYLIKNGLDKKRIIANGYSKKYTINPCITRYNSKNKSLQQDSRRAEIVLSENKKTDWATLELERGKNYYAVYNSSKVVSSLIVNAKINKDSIKAVQAHLSKQALEQKLESQKIAKAASKLAAETKAKEKAIALANEMRIKDSIKAVQAYLAKQALEQKLEAQKLMQQEAKQLAEQKNKEKANYIAVLKLKKEQILKEKLDQARKDSILIAKVTASRKRAKDSIAAVSLKALTAKPNVIIAKPDIVSTPKVAVEEDITKEEILKSLELLANLKLEQERIVEYLTKRINKKPIIIYVSSDSVSIEIYDNGIHDNDSVSVIYNKRIVVDKQELKVNKPIKFKLKVDKDSKNNELVFVADNLGTEPPNTGVMFITEKSGRRQQIILSTDMTHNEVIYFIRIEKQ